MDDRLNERTLGIGIAFAIIAKARRQFNLQREIFGRQPRIGAQCIAKAQVFHEERTIHCHRVYVKQPGADHGLGKKTTLWKYGLMLGHVLIPKRFCRRDPRFNFSERVSSDEHVNDGLCTKTDNRGTSNMLDSECRRWEHRHKSGSLSLKERRPS